MLTMHGAVYLMYVFYVQVLSYEMLLKQNAFYVV